MSFPRTAIAQLLAQLAGVPCQWVEQANAEARDAWIELTILADTPYGDGEYRQEPDPKNPDALVSRIAVWNQVTVSLRALSFDAEILPRDVLADVRTQVPGSVTAAAVYAAENIAFVRTHPISGVRGRSVRLRTRLEATMDVVWHTLDTGRAKDDPGQTIASVNGGGPIPVTGQ